MLHVHGLFVLNNDCCSYSSLIVYTVSDIDISLHPIANGCNIVALLGALLVLIMVAVCNRADHYVFILSFVLLLLLLLLLLLSFPRLISAVAGWMSAILLHMVWPHGMQRVTKNRHLGTIAQRCRALQLRRVSTIRKNLLIVICPPHVPTIWWTSAH